MKRFHPKEAIVSADAPGTAAAAMRIAREGGNVVDMAVGAALASTIGEILMSSLGGSGFLMIRHAGRGAELFDGSDMAPRMEPPPVEDARAWRRVALPYGDGIEVLAGHASVAVPGMLGALDLAWRRGGSMPWRELFGPAIDLARGPCRAGSTLGQWLEIAGRSIFFEQEASRHCFFPDGEHALRTGDSFIVPHMVETLEHLAEEGARALYEGDLGSALAREISENGGFVRRDDLVAYRAEQRRPLLVRSGDFDLALNPPPAIGGAAVGSLIGLLEAGWSAEASAAERALFHARAQKWLLGLRSNKLGDPEFDQAAARHLLEADTLRRHLGALQSPNTTHFSIATRNGDLAAVTLSNGYGSGIIVPQTGIVCNNSLGEPELNPWGFHRAPAGRRLVSNMAPTVAVARDGRCLALGSPGASRITTAISQTWTGFLLENRSFDEAVRGARLHIEESDDGFRALCEPGIDASLLGSEFTVRPFETLDMFFGAVKLAGLVEGNRLQAVADGRRGGTVLSSANAS